MVGECGRCGECDLRGVSRVGRGFEPAARGYGDVCLERWRRDVAGCGVEDFFGEGTGQRCYGERGDGARGLCDGDGWGRWDYGGVSVVGGFFSPEEDGELGAVSSGQL